MAFARTQGFEVHDWSGSNQASVHIVFGSAVAVGDCACVMTTAAVDPSSITETLKDQLINTYTRDSTKYAGGPNTGGSWWYHPSFTASGTPDLTYAVVPSQAFLAIEGDHFTGSTASSTRRDGKSQEQTGGSKPGTGTDAISSTSVAAQNGDLQWAGTMEAGGLSTSMVIGTGYTAGVAINATTTIITEWKTATAAGSGTFTDATHGGDANADYITGSIAITPGTSSPILGTRPRNPSFRPQVRLFAKFPSPPVNWGATPVQSSFTGTVAIDATALSVIALSGTSQDQDTGTISITVPSPVIAAAGTEKYTGTIAISVPNPVIALNGTVLIPATGTIAITVPSPVISLTGTGPVVVGGGVRKPKAQELPRRRASRMALEDLPYPVEMLEGRVGIKVRPPRIALKGWTEASDASNDDDLVYRLVLEDEDLALALTLADTWMG